jgi:hypothetical protein
LYSAVATPRPRHRRWLRGRECRIGRLRLHALDHVRAAVRRGRAGVPAPPGPHGCSAPAPTPHARPKTASPPSGRGSLTACYSPTGRIPTDTGEDAGDTAGDGEHTLVTRSAVTTSRWTRRLQAAGLVDVAADAYFPTTGAACSELERATVEHARARLVASGIAPPPQIDERSPTWPAEGY